ncbi:MAG TPA: GGDEF domain-containing protein, partial [Holophaga sp.]|nr:GGDEF domain-containing protein [Holophaga sp.]
LTGLHNRRYLAVTMPEEEIRLRRVFRNHLDRGESPLGRNEDLVLLMADLDHFKRVNDTYGHAAGDAVLQQTAQVMRGITRSSDTLVRWGGEEFLLVAKRTERDRADLIAQNLCSAIRNHTFELGDGRTLRCTISVGYAACPILDQNPEAFTWEDAAQAADQCLYAVKREGRDGWMGVHTPGPLDPVEVGPRLRVDIEGLAAEGKIVLRRSPR